MKKIIVSIILIGWLLTTSILSVNAYDVPQDQGQDELSGYAIPMADIYVDDDAGPGGDGSYEHPFQYIQDGIDAANKDDAIFVFSGVYKEIPTNVGGEFPHTSWVCLLVNKSSLNIIGENKETTIIHGLDNTRTEAIIRVTCGHITLTGFTIKGDNYYSGFGLEIRSNYNKIHNNIVKDNVKSGIILGGACYNDIYENIITGNGRWGGIYFTSENYNNKIYCNDIRGNLEHGLNNFGWGDNNVFYNNNFIDNPRYNAHDNDNNINIWMGNYWDDYMGEDNDGDGIGDTSYLLEKRNHDGYAEDRHPRMNPVVGNPLVASAGNGYKVKPWRDLTLTGIAGGGTEVYTYEWDLDNDGDYDDGEGASVTYSWKRVGTYTIRLKVTDDIGDIFTDETIVKVKIITGETGYIERVNLLEK